MRGNQRIEWPDGKAFAFTIFDDTDNATLEGVRPVYDFLRDIGLRTTKSVWAMKGAHTPARGGGATCDDPAYREWTLELQAAGFEIGSHGATPTTSDRALVLQSLNRFRAIYGHDPATLANHVGQLEAMYWGEDRAGGISKLAYNAMTRFQRRGVFRGHREGDPLFWGDLCQERIRYVRNFTFSGIDTLAACPVMPYYDPRRPYVNAWFASSEGTGVDEFNACIAQQDSLEANGGVCIMYTHLASGFSEDGAVHPRFRTLMERLAARNGWFVPVATVLDYMVDQRGLTVLTRRSRQALELRWLLSKTRVGHS